METAKERAISCKTLICFIQSLVGEVCDLELKNDFQLNGKLISVDAGMNIELKNVTLRKPTDLSLKKFNLEYCDYLFLRGEKLRYIQFSDKINVRNNIENKLDDYNRRGRGVMVSREPLNKKRF